MRVSLVRLLVVVVAAFTVVILRAQAPSDSANRVFNAFAELSQPAQGTRWPEVSRAARERRRQSWQQLLARARALSTANLTAPERLSLAIIDRDLVERLEGEPFDSYIRPLSAFEDGFQNGIMDRLTMLPTRTAADYEAIIAWIEDLPKYVDARTELLSESLQAGYSQSRRTTRLVAEQLLTQSEASAETTRLLAVFRALPASIAAVDQQRLRTRAEAAYRSNFVPASCSRPVAKSSGGRLMPDR